MFLCWVYDTTRTLKVSRSALISKIITTGDLLPIVNRRALSYNSNRIMLNNKITRRKRIIGKLNWLNVRTSFLTITLESRKSRSKKFFLRPFSSWAGCGRVTQWLEWFKTASPEQLFPVFKTRWVISFASRVDKTLPVLRGTRNNSPSRRKLLTPTPGNIFQRMKHN